jgi:hypothetical protein
LIRSDPAPNDDSDSLPIPDSPPNPPIVEAAGSAGRATGRPPPLNEVDGLAATGAIAGAAGLLAAFFAAGRLVVVLFFAVLRPLDAVVRREPARFAVLFLAVVRLAVAFLPPARLAVDFFAVAFFAFFLAAISPPFRIGEFSLAQIHADEDPLLYLRFIALAPGKDKH